MKAIILKSYGFPHKYLKKNNAVKKPASPEGDLLVPVHAASETFSNLNLAQGSPFFIRIMARGLIKPKPVFLGSDVVGRLETVGG